MEPEFTGQVILRPTFAPRPGISHVLFDFDGTLSLIRQGWPEVMVLMFTEVLPAVPGETEADRDRLAFEDIMRLNGKQTIYQMMQLAARIRERGGEAKEPLWYKHEYLRRLDLRIKDRIDGLRQGTIPADDLLVHGARRLLENLKDRGLPVYLPAEPTRSLSSKRQSCWASPRTSGAGSTAPRMISRRSPRSWSSRGSSARTASAASSFSPSATATSRSRTPRKSAAWPSPWPATRPTTALAGWTSGNASGSRASVPTS